MAPWPAGQYRLELTIDPGGVRRTLEIVVEGPAGEAPSSPPSDSPVSPGDSTAP
jgi:ribulose bisphosphate carboxylase small subunit